MRASVFLLIPLLVFMLTIDWYAFRGLKPLINQLRYPALRGALKKVFWIIPVVIFGAFVLFTFGISRVKHAGAYVYSGYLVAAFVLFYFPKFFFLLFVLLNDLRTLGAKLLRRFRKPVPEERAGKPISRSQFLMKVGLAVAAIPFGGILYGITKGRFDFRILRERLVFPDLPSAFSGLRIVQISDMHLGSLNRNFEAVAEAVDMINGLNPDLILFTGDLVNNFAEETDGWEPVLSSLSARMGKFSILGNHDYGDYSRWSSDAAKHENLEAIKRFHQQIGFRLLLNESEVLTCKEEHIALVGVENWGRPPFPQYGDIAKAVRGVEEIDFKIVLSHDPSYWDAELLTYPQRFALTLSGHTHGMQFGVEIPGIKWSPVQYKYPRWGGLYRESDRFLYVNRGFGYIGFPGRVGMPPEITVLELQRAIV